MFNQSKRKKHKFQKKWFILLGSMVSIISASIITTCVQEVSNSKITSNLNSSNTTTSNASISSRALNVNDYLSDARILPNNSTINVQMYGTDVGGNSFNISFNKERIDKFRGTNHSKTQNGYEYYNIRLNADNPSAATPGTWYQFINLIANGKYIWESGFSSNFNLLDSIITHFFNSGIDASRPIYVNLRQNGDGHYYKYCRVSDGVWWGDTLVLPQNDTVTLDSISSVDAKNSFRITDTVYLQGDQYKYVYNVKDGICFSLVIDPLTTNIYSADKGNLTLSEYLTWIRSTLSETKLIDYGNKILEEDAIILNRKDTDLNSSFATELVSFNNPTIYRNAINDWLVQNGVTSSSWEVSAVYNFDDPSLDVTASNAIRKIQASQNIVEANDKTGIVYKVIKLDNAFFFGKNKRIEANPVPWLYYLSNDPNNSNASYYLVKFETTAKTFSVSNIKYDAESKSFYLDLNNFTNLKQQLKTEWPSKILLSFDESEWISNLTNPSNSSVEISLNTKNDYGIPVRFDTSESLTTSPDVSLYNGFMEKIKGINAVNSVLLSDKFSYGTITNNSATFKFEIFNPLESTTSIEQFKRNVESGLFQITIDQTVKASTSQTTIPLLISDWSTNQNISVMLPVEVSTIGDKIQTTWVENNNTNIMNQINVKLEFNLSTVHDSIINYLFLDSTKNNFNSAFVKLQNSFVKALEEYLTSNFYNIFGNIAFELMYGLGGLTFIDLTNNNNIFSSALFDSPNKYSKPSFNLTLNSQTNVVNGVLGGGNSNSNLTQNNNSNAILTSSLITVGTILIIGLLVLMIVLNIMKKNKKQQNHLSSFGARPNRSSVRLVRTRRPYYIVSNDRPLRSPQNYQQPTIIKSTVPPKRSTSLVTVRRPEDTGYWY